MKTDVLPLLLLLNFIFMIYKYKWKNDANKQNTLQ